MSLEEYFMKENSLNTVLDLALLDSEVHHCHLNCLQQSVRHFPLKSYHISVIIQDWTITIIYINCL